MQHLAVNLTQPSVQRSFDAHSRAKPVETPKAPGLPSEVLWFMSACRCVSGPSRFLRIAHSGDVGPGARTGTGTVKDSNTSAVAQLIASANAGSDGKARLAPKYGTRTPGMCAGLQSLDGHDNNVFPF